MANSKFTILSNKCLNLTKLCKNNTLFYTTQSITYRFYQLQLLKETITQRAKKQFYKKTQKHKEYCTKTHIFVI